MSFCLLGLNISKFHSLLAQSHWSRPSVQSKIFAELTRKHNEQCVVGYIDSTFSCSLCFLPFLIIFKYIHTYLNIYIKYISSSISTLPLKIDGSGSCVYYHLQWSLYMSIIFLRNFSVVFTVLNSVSKFWNLSLLPVIPNMTDWKIILLFLYYCWWPQSLSYKTEFVKRYLLSFMCICMFIYLYVHI